MATMQPTRSNGGLNNVLVRLSNCKDR